MQCIVCATAMNLKPHGACKHYPWGSAVIHMPCHLGCLLQHVVQLAAIYSLVMQVLVLSCISDLFSGFTGCLLQEQ